MKIMTEEKMKPHKKITFSNFFVNLYYFFALHLTAVFYLLCAAVGIAILLFVAELLFPSAIHFFNYKLTEKTFDELVEEHRYHAAIAFMDMKDDVLAHPSDIAKYRMELADCYVNIGDYPKAIEQYDLLRKAIATEAKKSTDDLSKDELQMVLAMSDLYISKEEFRTYLKMGDKQKILEKYHSMKEKSPSINWKLFDKIIADADEDFPEWVNGEMMAVGFNLELIQGEYYENPQLAIDKMEKYAVETARSKEYGYERKLKVWNALLKMLIEQGQTIKARHYLELALRTVDLFQYSPAIFEPLGELSEYCYTLHDIYDGKRLLKKHLSLIDDKYDDNSIEYLSAHSRMLKYLQADGEWDEFEETAEKVSQALRAQIMSNFAGMTAAQREYLVQQFQPIFENVSNAAADHPSEKLLRINFENIMFQRGLLLRSETNLRNSIAAMDDKALSAKYDEYIQLSRELTARNYVSGPGNAYEKSQLKKQIAVLEQELSTKSMDFRREHTAPTSIDALRKSLASDEVVLTIAESRTDYYAMILDKSGKVSIQTLGSKDFIGKEIASGGAFYANPALTNRLFGGVIEAIKGKTVFYTPTDLFNQISLSTMKLSSDRKTLGDIAQWRLVGSPTDIPDIKKREPSQLLAHNALLWGGVNYGDSNSILADSDTLRGIERGVALRYLPGSLSEVNAIGKLIADNKGKVAIFTGDKATEHSFKLRNGKRDYVLHISTHGFFHDDKAFDNPMQNSGLLFANSQPYWEAGKKSATINESDGILRADEISGLDLTGCRLVVLSACQTGLGFSDNAEGVYGLQRAFKLAGVENVLMSLWKVDDTATSKLMTSFYRYLITGQNPDTALRNAKNDLRRQGYSPNKWGAFILLN